MSRYPYTYAADFLRDATVDPHDITAGCSLSRAGASKIRQAIAAVIGMDDDELAEKLADQYLKEQRP